MQTVKIKFRIKVIKLSEMPPNSTVTSKKENGSRGGSKSSQRSNALSRQNCTVGGHKAFASKGFDNFAAISEYYLKSTAEMVQEQVADWKDSINVADYIIELCFKR